MMIPPVIRLGYPTEAQHGERYAVLHREFGWVIATKASAGGYYYHNDEFNRRAPIHQDNIICWMPQDGS